MRLRGAIESIPTVISSTLGESDRGTHLVPFHEVLAQLVFSVSVEGVLVLVLAQGLRKLRSTTDTSLMADHDVVALRRLYRIQHRRSVRK